MSFITFENKRIVVFGLANKKSVAYFIARELIAAGAEVLHVVRSQERRKTAKKLFPDCAVFVCDVEEEENIVRVRQEIAAQLGAGLLDGIVHSIAYANYSEGFKPFHETRCQDFLQAVNISCFSFARIFCRPSIFPASPSYRLPIILKSCLPPRPRW